jgi:hypothetical protein
MEKIFNTFDLVVDVYFGYSRIGLLLEVSWGVNLVARK